LPRVSTSVCMCRGQCVDMLQVLKYISCSNIGLVFLTRGMQVRRRVGKRGGLK
jgi:hypothetical protein